MASYVQTGKLGATGSYLVEGIGQEQVPPICDLSRTKRAYTISDSEAFATTRELLQAEGILGGTSTGTLLAAALRYCREQSQPKRVVTFVCDTGNKYLSKAFNDAWLTDHGLVRSKETGDLRDFIGRSHERGDVLSVGAEDSLAFAHSRMRLGDVSQLPVLEDNKIVGLVDESDLLVSVAEDPAGFSKPVRSVMSDRLETVDVSTPYRELLPIFERGLVAIVVRRGDFLGLITRYDLLNTLRRRVSG